MFANLKLAVAGGLCAAALPVLAMRPAEQEPDAFAQEATWNLAVLQYSNDRNELVEIPARLLTKVWLLKTEDGRMRMEILFKTRDYTSVDIRDFSVIRTSPGSAAVDVPFVRASIDSMAFPSFK